MTAIKVELDLNAIQGTVLRGYRLPFGSYVYLRINDMAAGREWIASVTGMVTTAAPWNTKPDQTLNLAFSASGLQALGVTPEVLAGFSTPFLAGMAARAGILGDTEESAPKNWEDGLGTPDVHIVVSLLASSLQALADHEKWLAASLGDGLSEIGRLGVSVLPSGGEHFGYSDGFSQPAIEGLDVGPRTGLGAATSYGAWRPIRAGEFVLGYADEEGILPEAPGPDALARNGSYMAVRKLRQNVVGFREMLAQTAKVYSGSEEMLAAKLVGRWRDGTPLDMSPRTSDPDLAADTLRNNAFDYSDDKQGYRCPIGAHVRRANPRLSMPFDGKLVNRHRLVRRGLPYGPELPDGAPDDGVERGVLFVCFQADLERQFEFIQSQWLNDGNAFGLGTDKDPMLGNNDGTGKHTIHGSPPSFVGSLPRFITTAGGEYFFAPGINGLRYLSRPMTPHPNSANHNGNI